MIETDSFFSVFWNDGVIKLDRIGGIEFGWIYGELIGLELWGEWLGWMIG